VLLSPYSVIWNVSDAL